MNETLTDYIFLDKLDNLFKDQAQKQEDMPEESEACGNPSRSRLILKDCRLWRGLVLEQGKSVKKKEKQSGDIMN